MGGDSQPRAVQNNQNLDYYVSLPDEKALNRKADVKFVLCYWPMYIHLQQQTGHENNNCYINLCFQISEKVHECLPFL